MSSQHIVHSIKVEYQQLMIIMTRLLKGNGCVLNWRQEARIWGILILLSGG